MQKRNPDLRSFFTGKTYGIYNSLSRKIKSAIYRAGSYLLNKSLYRPAHYLFRKKSGLKAYDSVYKIFFNEAGFDSNSSTAIAKTAVAESFRIFVIGILHGCIEYFSAGKEARLNGLRMYAGIYGPNSRFCKESFFIRFLIMTLRRQNSFVFGYFL